MGLTFTTGGVVGTDRDVVRFGPLRFWAENGLIHVEDARDNSYDCMSVRTALRRANAISEMLGNSTDREMYTEDQFDQANRQRHLNMLEGITAIMQQLLDVLERQGPPLSTAPPPPLIGTRCVRRRPLASRDRDGTTLTDRRAARGT